MAEQIIPTAKAILDLDTMISHAKRRGHNHQNAVDLAYDILDWLEGWDNVAGWPNKESWDGICVSCGYDFRECHGECTCLSCGAERLAMDTAMLQHYGILERLQ